MPVISVAPPFIVFDDVRGESLEDGQIYIGIAGTNPLILANRIAVYSNSALTIPLAQPVRTDGGYPVNGNGSPVQIYAGVTDYSIAVLDGQGGLIYSSLSNKTKFGLIDLATDVTGQLSSILIAYAITAAEILAGVVPVNLFFRPGDIRRYGAVGDNSTNCTDAFVDAEAANDAVYIPAGTWRTDSIITTRAGICFQTEGFKTVIQQNIGTSNVLPVIQIKHSDCVLETCTIKGNIATDTLEFKHACMVYNGAASLQNVTVGDLYCENIRGDGLYIGAPAAQTTRYVTFGRIVGRNILRNVVSVVGGCYVRGDAAVVDASCGYAAFDVEPDSVVSTDVHVGYVRGGVLQIAPPTAAVTARRIAIDMVDLDPGFQANSVPAYSGYSVANAVQLRNTVGLTIGYLKIRNHTGLGINYIFNVGEQLGEAIDIGYLDVANVGSGEAVFNAVFQGQNVRSARIRDGNVALQAVGDYLFIGDSSGAKDNEIQIDRMQINGTLIRYGRNCRFANIRVNSANAVFLIREVDDSILEASDITLPNLLTSCANMTLLGVRATCSALYFGAAVTGTTIFGASGGLAAVLAGSAVYDPPNLADGAGVTTTVTAVGANIGDFVDVGFSVDLQGITMTGYVSVAGTVSVRFQNETGGAINLASGTLRVRVRQA